VARCGELAFQLHAQDKECHAVERKSKGCMSEDPKQRTCRVPAAAWTGSGTCG
jgi:hypothetical protein